MRRRGTVLVVALAVSAALAAHHQAGSSPAGTLVLRGSMASTAVLTMTGDFSVGHAANLDWDLPRQQSVDLNSYAEHVDDLSYQFSVPPDSSTDLVEDGHAVRRFHWNAPPANTVIHLVETLRTSIVSQLTPFHSTATYPLTSIPADVSPYAASTPMTQLSPSTFPLVQKLAQGAGTEEAVVDAAANWVATHTRYSVARMNGPYDASWVFAHHEATCEGYDNLMVGILRQLGIPAQVEYGWVSAAPLRLPGPNHTTTSIQWSTPGTQGDLHTWLNIYFPGTGWVPFDPQREKYFVDPRHIAFLTDVEAGSLQLGTWSADPVDGQSAAGQALANSATEIVPADGIGSQVTVHMQDDFHVALSGVRSDVKNILLLTR